LTDVVLLFVAKICQSTKVTFYIQKSAKLRTTWAQLFQNFCATSATSSAQLLDFFSATFWGD